MEDMNFPKAVFILFLVLYALLFFVSSIWDFKKNIQAFKNWFGYFETWGWAILGGIIAFIIHWMIISPIEFAKKDIREFVPRE
jgi:prolipoprotein diacylglyceryltransferase